MTTLLYTHPVCLEHDTGYGHPECAARLTAILGALRTPQFAALEWRDVPQASVEQLTRSRAVDADPRVRPRRAHVVASTQARTFRHRRRHHHFAAVRRSGPARGGRRLRSRGCDPARRSRQRILRHSPTRPSRRTEPSDGILSVQQYCHRRRPRSRRSRAGTSGGHRFRCASRQWLASRFRARSGLSLDDPAYLYISTHQAYIYPGTGRRDERGVGNIVNIPLLANSGSAELAHAWRQDIGPALRQFQPQLILISAGFDAHHMDPLAELAFSETEYAWLTQQILEIAGEFCEGRVVSVLEGGYSLPALATSVAAHVKALMEGAGKP